jgi:transposase
VAIGDENVKVYLFLVTLGYSRRLYVRAFRNERQESWFAGVEGAFRHFDGIPEEVLLVAGLRKAPTWAPPAGSLFGL